MSISLSRHGNLVAIRTACRVCGNDVLLEVSLEYDDAVRNFYGLDDQVMTCGNHEERGGWGVHWRFDEVLRLVFPAQFRRKANGGYWPKPPWYNHCRQEGRSVQFVTYDEMRKAEERIVDERRLQIMEELNRRPRDRPTLEQEVGQVWDTVEVAKDFEVLGYRTPFVIVVRRSDGVKGSLLFQQEPRLYFGFEEARVL